MKVAGARHNLGRECLLIMFLTAVTSLLAVSELEVTFEKFILTLVLKNYLLDDSNLLGIPLYVKL